jgi:hypothetical protein
VLLLKVKSGVCVRVKVALALAIPAERQKPRAANMRSVDRDLRRTRVMKHHCTGMFYSNQ